MKRIPIYIAGASADWRMVADLGARLRSTGLVEITLPWWYGAEYWTGRDDRLTLDEQSAQANDCLESLATSRIVWVVWSSTPSTGRAVELGAALERRRILGEPYIVLTGDGCGSSLFHAVDYRHPDHELGLTEVCGVARALRDKEAIR